MTQRPTAWGNFTALLRGEVEAGVLEAFRRAGSGVYDLADEVEEKRRLLCLAGRSPWQFPLQFQTELLCSWNALVFQSLGDRLLLDDYKQDPSSVGVVPEATYEQTERCYGQVRSWLVAARMASSSEGFRVRGSLPVPMPHLSGGGEARAARVRVLQSMCDFLLGRLDPVVEWYQELGDDRESHRRTHDAMAQLYAEATARSEYADDLLADPQPPLLELADADLQASVAKLHALGQYAAMPGLLRDAVARLR